MTMMGVRTEVTVTVTVKMKMMMNTMMKVRKTGR